MAAAAPQPIKAPSAAAKFLPVAIAAGAVSVVVGYVSSQLHNQRNIMDSRFAQYNNTQSEAQRRKTFEGTNLDPRRSMFNILGH